MAGPCSVESREQIVAVARSVKSAGAQFLRGGAFKPRSSPYSFQGMKEEGLVLLREAREKTGLAIVTEVKDTGTLPAVAEVADVLQIGARNMSNFSLLEAVGELRTAGASQARHRRDDRRTADGGGVHREPRQSADHPVRAGDPDLRNGDTEHAGSQCGARAQDDSRIFP